MASVRTSRVSAGFTIGRARMHNETTQSEWRGDQIFYSLFRQQTRKHLINKLNTDDDVRYLKNVIHAINVCEGARDLRGPRRCTDIAYNLRP